MFISIYEHSEKGYPMTSETILTHRFKGMSFMLSKSTYKTVDISEVTIFCNLSEIDIEEAKRVFNDLVMSAKQAYVERVN